MNFFYTQKPIYIKGPSGILPEKIMSNEDIINWTGFDYQPTVISFSTGILTRHWVTESQACSDLAIMAAEALFDQKPEERKKITQLILATISGDYLSPPTSPLIQHRLGLTEAGSFDLGAACAGFVVGLHTSAALAQATSGNILLIASEIRSKFLNKDDFATSALFGDAASACIIATESKNAEFRFIASALFSDGEVGDLVSIPTGGSRFPAAYCKNSELNFITIKETSALFVKAVQGMAESAEQFLKKIGMTSNQIDWLVPHQANKHIILAVANQLGISETKVVTTIEFAGNTAGSSVGIALYHLKQHTPLKPGEKILLVAAGGGGIAACALLSTL